MTRITRPVVALFAAALLLVLAAALVLAKEEELLGGKLRTGDTVSVPATETVEGDLYLLAGTVTMDGTVNGDLMALGGQVNVNGTVTGDVLVAGGTVALAGAVEGDVRMAGGQATVAGSIGEDLVVTGGQSTLSAGSTVGGDLIVSGGQVIVAGAVTGSIEGGAGTYSRSGPRPGGTEHVVVSPRGADEEEEELLAGDVALDAIRHFVVLVLLGALLLWLLPRTLLAAEAALRTRPLPSLGAGLAAFVGYIVFLIVAFLLMIVLGLLFGLLRLGSLVGVELIAGLLTVLTVSFLFVVAVAFLADIVVALALAHLAMPAAGGNRWRELALLAAGAAVVVVATSIPIIGGWVKLAVVLFGLGALTLVAWGAWQSWRARPAAPPPVSPPLEPTTEPAM